MKNLMFICSLLLPLFAAADQYDQRLIHTNDYGEVKVKPDMARISLSVSATRKVALDAKTEVDQRVGRFLVALKKANIKKKDIIASGIRTNPQYEHNKLASKRVFTGYIATRNLTITVRQLEQLTNIMDLALADKIQNIGHISYESSEADKHRDQARAKAIENSKRKAKALAKAYDAELGSIVNIQYRSNRAFPATSNALMEARLDVSARGRSQQATYLPDEITFSDNIQVAFDLIVNQ